ncbi:MULTISPECIES: 30S ribosome-binding factor RbfA [Brevibacterium]|uniref:Ribosome-binding factor A n=2 Tax=Brevibacterium TaxID=1696 RepID=A0A2H1L3A3_9MICO|nr:MULTISPECIES: 30S ribosome-binding factor RbfA [Brevibacterium]TWC02517.1 ribosome-binding factor A [Brevibacterium jeotgali]SLM99619.1 Ribosome-binding factor A [Brevibacterium yomogidense]SMY11309.1 ribosome-binding factor A [Brevibacterium jeotgali]
MADSTRARKVADRIKVIVASTLEKRVKDPRLGFVTVTDVRLTGDLQNATVFYTVFGTDTDLEATRAALESARGLIRSEVGKGLTIRLTPTIEFVADAVPAAAAELDELLARAKARDAEIAELARDADPVGDPDPYRRGPDEEASDAESGADSGAQDRSHD